MEDFYFAGGLTAVLKTMQPILHMDHPTVNGMTLGQNVMNAKVHNNEVIRPLMIQFQKMEERQSSAETLHPMVPLLNTRLLILRYSSILDLLLFLITIESYPRKLTILTCLSPKILFLFLEMPDLWELLECLNGECCLSLKSYSKKECVIW